MKATIIPTCQPKLPDTESLIPYLKKIDANRWYSNYGPLVQEFLNRFATLFKVERTHVASAVNGTVILELCLKAMNIQKGSLCIMPAWTFTATPLAAINAGLEPYFVDVGPEHQCLDPNQLEHSIERIMRTRKIGAVIAVAPFGSPINTNRWDAFTARTGIPVIIDAAAAFDTVLQVPAMQVTHTPMMISLHATKLCGIGEGGIILSKNAELINQIECLTQFGFPKGIRNTLSFGTNAKLSEYAGAVGLAALDSWPQTRSGWKTISTYYQAVLAKVGIAHMLSADWMPCTCNVILPKRADQAAIALEKTGILARKWWGNGCHQQPAFAGMLCDDLSNTTYLAESILGLPFYLDMTTDTIDRVVKQLAEIIERERV